MNGSGFNDLVVSNTGNDKIAVLINNTPLDDN
jgi:hypothetical protein